MLKKLSSCSCFYAPIAFSSPRSLSAQMRSSRKEKCVDGGTEVLELSQLGRENVRTMLAEALSSRGNQPTLVRPEINLPAELPLSPAVLLIHVYTHIPLLD